MAFDFNGKFYEGNLYITKENKCYAIYKLNGQVYDFISIAKQKQLFRKDNTLLQSIDSSHVSILGKPYFTSIGSRHNIIKKTAKGPLKHVAEAHMDNLTDYLVEMRGEEGNKVEKYLIVKLRPTFSKRKGIKGIADAAVETYINVNNMLGIGDELPVRVLDAFKRSEESVFYALSNNVIRANEMDQEWLIKSPMFRGIGEPKLRSKKNYEDDSDDSKHWKPSYEKKARRGIVTLSPNRDELISLCPGNVKMNPTDRHLTIDHGHGKVSYQSFYTVSDLPDEIVFPGDEWIYYLDALGFPVEWSINIDFIENVDILSRIGYRKKVVLDQAEHTASTEQVTDDLVRAVQDGPTLESEMKSSKDKYTLTNFSLCVYADNLETLNQRKVDLEDYLDKFDVEVQNPVADQLKMFCEFFPGAAKQTRAFVRKITTKVIASTMFRGSKSIGDFLGFFIGYTGKNKEPVHIDPRRASQTDFSPSMAAVGTLGGGKSFLMKLFAYMNAIFGGKSLIIDPKRENKNWLKYLPWLKGHLDILELSGQEKDYGKLDPFMITGIVNKTGAAKETAKARAYEIAVSILTFNMGAKRNDDITLAISAACEYARDHKVPCMLRVEEYINGLYKEDKEQEWLTEEYLRLSRYIKHLKSMSITQLLFGDGENKVVSFDKAISIVQIQGLTLPTRKENPDNYTPIKLASMSIMIALSSMMREFAFSNRNIFKFIGMDEQWFFKIAEIGAQIIEEIVRQGRTINTGIYLIDQNASNYSSDIKNNIGIKFVYRTPDSEQAALACDFIGLEASEENLKTIMNIPKYHVLVQDLEGRVQMVRIDVAFDSLKEAFNSRPMDENPDPQGDYYEAAA